METNVFGGIFDTAAVTIIAPEKFFLCLGAALAVGLIIAAAHRYKNRYSKGFLVTLALIPAVVSMVIMMVNGNIGAGVAVAGAFSLVRFRSVPGSAKDIGAIFLAMGSGLAIGMGYLTYGILFTFVLCGVNMVYGKIGFGGKKGSMEEKTLKITIPEDLDYTGVFDDLLQEYTVDYELLSVKTTNMGSLFNLKYSVTLRNRRGEKEFIDKLRCRNGNLEISVCGGEIGGNEL